jgi:hypothetical protein
METYPVPLILKCNATGKTVKYYSRPYIEQRIAKAGDLATLVNTFMAKGAKKKTTQPSTKTWKGEEIIKNDKPVAETQAASGIDNNKGEKVFTYSDGPNCRVVYPSS